MTNTTMRLEELNVEELVRATEAASGILHRNGKLVVVDIRSPNTPEMMRRPGSVNDFWGNAYRGETNAHGIVEPLLSMMRNHVYRRFLDMGAAEKTVQELLTAFGVLVNTVEYLEDELAKAKPPQTGEAA